MKKKLLIIVVVLLIIGLVWWWRRDDKVEVLSKETVSRGIVRQTLILSGEVNANEYAELRFQTAGMTSWVGVKEGDRVNKFQAIAGLDTRAVKKNLEQKLNNYLTYRWNFEQTQDDNRDWEIKSMSDEEREAIKRIVEKSQFGLNNAVLDVELQDLAVKFSTLTTPIGGIVIRAEPQFAGVNVTPSSSVFEVVNPETIYFEVKADQEEVVDLSSNQKVNITLDSFEDRTVEGLLSYISYTPDPTESGTVYLMKVEAGELKTNSKIRLGMTGDAEFVRQEKLDVLWVPNEYIQSDDEGKNYVWVDENGTKANIEIGIEGDDRSEVLNGLSEGQEIYIIGS